MLPTDLSVQADLASLDDQGTAVRLIPFGTAGKT